MRKNLIWIGLGVLSLTGCASTGLRQAESLAARGEWLKAVMEYRAEYENHPGNVEIKSSLRQAELRAAEYYYQRGLRRLAEKDFDNAIAQFELGLAAMPNHEKIRSVLNSALGKKEAERLYVEAKRFLDIRQYPKAQAALVKAQRYSPGDERIEAALEQVEQASRAATEGEYVLSSDEPVTLSFRDASLRTAFNFLSESFGINVIFDESVEDRSVTLFARNVSFKQALQLLVATTRTFHKRIGPKTLLIAPDTKEKRGQYEDYIIRTFELTNADAKAMADQLKGVLSLQKVVVNPALNTITIRDTEEVLNLAEKLIRANDRQPAEMILEVEILEVNRQKARQLGFDYGSSITATFPEYPVSESFVDTLEQGTVTLPSITFRYYKQNVDAKILANPKIRVLDGKEAKIHIGDRVPLRSSTIQEATGQTRTTFQYTDIGIRLIVEPQIQMDNSTLVKMALEVSSLGQNLGTPTEPAFSIGTRNAETYMLLRDGETAILGGLIRDEERTSRLSIPGLGDIPILGGLFFSETDDSILRTDVLLTITPRVIRPWDMPPEDTRKLYSGTAERYGIRPLISPNGVKAAAARDVLPAPKKEKATLKFGQENYSMAPSERILVPLELIGLSGSGEIPVRLRFDAELVALDELGGSADCCTFKDVHEVAPGEVSATLVYEGLNNGKTTVGTAVLEGKREGVSYLVLGGTAAQVDDGIRIPTLSYSAHVVIK